MAVAGDRGRIAELGLVDVVSRWKKEGGRGQRPGITTSEILGGKRAKDKSLFDKPKYKPTKEQKRDIIALA